ncbi:hypothetical protein SAMN04488508_103455 [Aquimarina spongiae]|uniref:Fibronectin type-III domain-containing protein n=2 Tax=Aquimarina spongiae TaxID=570521 RepID=A0A1M6EKP4_9FLAO|nr:hypothetical protein SAMN04488508_103455 [Aquimarina spongiae]
MMKKPIIYSLLFIGILFGCEEAFIEEDLTDAIISIIAPQDGAQIEDASINFSWTEVDQATSYRLQVARPNFENAAQIVLDTTVTTSNFNATLAKNSYEWRVRAQNSGSATAYSGAQFSVIEAADFSSREVLLTSPENELITNTAAQTLTWQVVPDANTYRIRVLNTDDEVQQEETTNQTSLAITFPEGVSRWQVRAENATQNTLFTTRTLTLDTMDPNTPVGTAPANDATLTDTEVTFSWTREAVQGSVEFDSIYIFEDQALTQLVTKDRITSPSEITLEASKTYYWFLKAFDEAQNESANSTTLRFTIN